MSSAAKWICSLLVNASVALTQLNVLSVAPLIVIPPPSAVTSVGVDTLAKVIFLSSTSRVLVFRVVVVPLTVRVPVTLKSLGISTSPSLVTVKPRVVLGPALNVILPVEVAPLYKSKLPA